MAASASAGRVGKLYLLRRTCGLWLDRLATVILFALDAVIVTVAFVEALVVLVGMLMYLLLN